MTKPVIKYLYLALPLTTSNDGKMISAKNHFLHHVQQLLHTAQTTAIFRLEGIFITNSANSSCNSQLLTSLLALLAPLIAPDCEYTFETKGQLSLPILALLQQYRINRLVWKIATFRNKSVMINNIKQAINYGFSNFSLDLQYNLPNQTWKTITNDLQIALSLQAPHISYDSANDNDNQTIKTKINNFLHYHHYYHYEYYSYARTKKDESRYVRAYCLLANYFGVGANATSYMQMNNNATIITTHNEYDQIAEILVLNSAENFYQRLCQGLLLKTGLTLTIEEEQKWQLLLTNLVNKKLIKCQNHQIFCTNKGWRLLNTLIVDIINNTIM